MNSFSIIIPAYNEEQGIGAVLARLHQLYPTAEIIVIDDASTDHTADVAASSGAKVVSHPANAGYGASLKDGIRAASNDIIVIIDADGTYPAERIADLVSKMDAGFDMVVGARAHQHDSLLKIPARLVFRFLVEFTTGSRIPDINSGLRAFRKSQVMPYFPDLCQGFSFTTTITLIYKLTGKFVAYIPIDYAKRVGKSKVSIIRDSLRTLQYITEVIVLYNPLKLFLLLTLVLVFLAALFLIGVFLFPMLAIVLSVLAGSSLIGSVVVFSLGLIAFGNRRARG